MSKYKELCQTFSLKEVIQEPTRIRSTTFSLLGHILTNAGWKISQKGVIDVIFWFKSYLSHRKFKVNLNKSFSEPGQLLCGVPQGSVLGQLLFLLYINDMPQAVLCELLLYADDICVIFQHSDINEIEIQLNKNFSSICD